MAKWVSPPLKIMTRIPLILSLLALSCLLTPFANGQGNYYKYNWQQYLGTGNWYAITDAKLTFSKNASTVELLGGYLAFSIQLHRPCKYILHPSQSLG